MTNKIKNNQSNQGQIAIIVLLASAILLTLGMSASRKTVTDTKVDTDEELLKEAFNTAESGINNYLLNIILNIILVMVIVPSSVLYLSVMLTVLLLKVKFHPILLNYFG
ncbi:MAG: hypothetical protein PHE71_01085 [Candidatus Shapirobacteria bacterium]|nr:hypothetical protein [Candidatus Shapirobacteria bacterium]